MSKFLILGFIIVLSLVGVLGDFFIKLAGNGSKYMDVRLFLIGLVVYASTAFGWFYVMKEIKLGTLGVYYALGTVLFLTLLSIFYFKEQFTHYETIGIVLGIASLILLGRYA